MLVFHVLFSLHFITVAWCINWISSYFKWTLSSQWSKTGCKITGVWDLITALALLSLFYSENPLSGLEINQSTTHLQNIIQFLKKNTIRQFSLCMDKIHINSSFFSKSTGNTNTFQISALAWSAMHQYLNLTPHLINMQSYSSSYKNQILTKDWE